MLKEKIEKYLLSVQKPARYIGGEAGAFIKTNLRWMCGLRSAFRTAMTSA